MNKQSQDSTALPRWMRPAILVLSGIAIMLASVFLLSISVIIPINLFVPGVGDIDTPDVVFYLELAFLLLASVGITGVFLRWIGKQTGTRWQHFQSLGILILLILVETVIFTFYWMILPW